MVFIYKLECEGLVLYVGRTKNINDRYRKHCTRKDTCGSSEIPHDMIWKMVILEECEDVVGTSREQYYYDTLKPLYNKCRPGQTRREYQRAHPEQKKESNRRYREANREAYRAWSREGMRRYRAKNKDANNARNREYCRRYRDKNRDAINARRLEIARAKKHLNGALTTQSQEEVAV